VILGLYAKRRLTGGWKGSQPPTATVPRGRGRRTDGSAMAGTQEVRAPRRRVKSPARELRFCPRPNQRDAENMILKALPPEERRYLCRYLESVSLKFGEVLWEPNGPIQSVYFPDNGMVSFVAVMRNGATAEVGMTGREGFIGTPVVLGARDSPLRAVVQIDGGGFRIESDVLRRILPQVPQLEQMLRRYAHAHAMQVAQAAACNCLHQVPERLARWLAMTYHLTGCELLPLTQEFLAQMLGCRRSSVTAAIGSLQRAGVICCGRGHVHILNWGQLENSACECYGVMRRLSYSAQIG
jgi:CRP-like cAMP-binding protein